MSSTKNCGTLAAALFLSLTAPTQADFVPPPHSGYVNVKTDCGAKGDGVSDDTAALKAILERGKHSPHKKFGAARAVYFPNGVYLIREPILIGDKRKILIGQSRDGVVLKLKDNSPPFQDPKKPAAVLSLATSYRGWHFAQNFGQRIHNLTVDVGADNPRAVGIEYHTNNSGDVYNVLIRSADPQKRGHAGLSLLHGSGPGLVHNVTVDGFDIGINFGHNLHSMSFSRVTLRDQRAVGFWNRGNTASIETLISDNKVPALRQSGGFTAITCGDFRGGADDAVAVELLGGEFFGRHLRTSGYRAALVDPKKAVHRGPALDQFVWPEVHSLFDSPKKSLNLRIEHPPIPEPPAGARWHLVRPDGDDLTKPLQQAIDAGHEYIFVSAQKFAFLRDTIRVRNKVKVITGAPTNFRSVGFPHDKLTSYKPLLIQKAQKWKPLWRIEDGASDVVLLKFLSDLYGSAGWDVEHASKRTLILWAAGGAYKNTVTGGKVFFIDSGPFPGTVIKGPQRAWSWSANPESYVYSPSILNLGAILWLLGIKTEKDRTVITTKGGGYTELIGGLLFKNRERIGPASAFVNDNSHVSLSFKITRLPYQQHVTETRDGQTRELPFRAAGWEMPLYTGYATPPAEQHRCERKPQE